MNERPTLLLVPLLGLALSIPLSASEPEKFIRARHEGKFSVAVRQAAKTASRVIGTLGGREVLEIDAPNRIGNMGKIMAEDPKGAIWYLETREDLAVRIDPKTLAFTEYQLPRGSGPYSHAIDSKGVHWITAHGIEMLLEFDPQKREVISHAPPSFGFLIHINVSPIDDTVYFGQPGANKIVAYRRDTGFREYLIPTPNAGPGRFDFDSKGHLWFPELYADKVARLDPATGKIEEWDLPFKHGTPSYCRVDKDDVVWISLPMGDRILRFEKGEFKEYKIPTPGSVVSTTIADETGAIWFTEGGWRGSAGGNKIGRLDPANGKFEELALSTPNAQPLGLIIARNGVIWFEQMNAGKICRVDVRRNAEKPVQRTSIQK